MTVCATASDCGQSSSTCEGVICHNSLCLYSLSLSGTPCTDHGGHVCDGLGKCVQCVAPTDCDPAPCKVNQCSGGVCSQTNAPQGSACQDPSTGGITCDGAGNCVSGRYVFVTTDAYAPTFGVGTAVSGPQNADTVCQKQAQSVGLEGKWMAWLSDSTTAPAQRFTQSLVPYLLLDGTMVAADWKGLTSGSLMSSILLTQAKAKLQTEVWTGTLTDGTVATAGSVPNVVYQTCGDWRQMPVGTKLAGAMGSSSASDGTWTMTAIPANCSSGTTVTAHLYCFQQ